MIDPNKPNVKFAITGDDSASIKQSQDIKTDGTLMTIDEMLEALSTYYHRPISTRELKISIIESYATLFTLLGTEFVETNYATIVKHVFKDILECENNNNSKHITLDAPTSAFIRAQVFFLLHNTIGKRLLSEQGQASAIHILVTQWLKSWPSLVTNQPPPSKNILITAINLVSALVAELEGATVSVQVSLTKLIIFLIS